MDKKANIICMVYLLCLSANGLPVTDAPNRKVTVKDIYENFHQYLSPDALQFLEEEMNSVSIEEDEYFELNGKKISAAELYQLLELEEQKYAHWFFMSVPSDILHDNATSKFEFNDPAYDPMNFTVSGRSWLNRQRKSWKRRPRSAENDTGNAEHTENDLEDTRSDGNGTENEWDEKNYVIISDDAAFEEFLAEFNKNWTSSFFELPKRGRSKDVQFRFTAPRPFAGNRRPRVFFPRDGQSPNDVDAPPDFQPQINLTELFFGTTHSMVGDNETLVDYLKEMNKVEDTLTSQRTEAYRNGSLNPLDVSRSHLEFILFYGLDAPRDFQTNVTLRNTMARYLSNKMERFGLLAGTQTYEPHQYPEIFPEKIPKGINIIGVLPGRRWGTKDDEIILLAAHWDTVEGSNGMDDNGSGVSVVLEVARALTEAKCVTEFSVMFVLFDLEEVGCIGSIYFIRDYLIPHVLDAHGGAKLKGAYILDTVMNYNNTPGSQIWPEEWNRQIPGRLEELEQDNMTGNFLAALYRKGVDSTLATTLSKHYKIQNKPELKPDSPYHIKEFEMDLSADMPPVDELAKWIDLLRSDHSRFWFHNLEYPWSFPAVLLTDTGPYRGDMQQCYHNSCDSYSSAGYNNVEFLASTAKALIDSTIELSQAQCRGRSPTVPSTANNNSSFNFSSFISSLMQILGQLGVNIGNKSSQAEQA